MLPFAIPAILGSPVTRYLITGIIVTSILVGGYFYIGSRFTADCKRDYAAARAESIERAAEEARAIALQDAEIINWSDNVRTKPVFVPIWKEHENTVYADCTLTPAQRVLYNRATRYATDLSDTDVEGESSEVTSSTGNGESRGNGGEARSTHGDVPSIGSGSGSSSENVEGSWFIGWSN